MATAKANEVRRDEIEQEIQRVLQVGKKHRAYSRRKRNSRKK
ncbi:hypothetical protein [Sporosarcina jiandibaonis]|nr:hypothetical protein [Sporosarcina jiandibaonis]